jgi:hypothetical protein
MDGVLALSVACLGTSFVGLMAAERALDSGSPSEQPEDSWRSRDQAPTRSEIVRSAVRTGIVALALAAAGPAAAAVNIFTVAGTGTAGSSGNGLPATWAKVNHPRGLAATSGGGFLFAEPYNNVVRRVCPDGRITRVAGTGAAGFSGDGGPAVRARLNFVHGVALTPGGGLVIADTRNNRIRRVWPDGTIRTIAAGLGAPRGVAVAADGSILVPDTNHHRIRRIAANGTITTVAGTGTAGFSGDGGPATSARLNLPFGVAPTADGGLLIADAGNHRIRRVSPSGTITTVAGNGVNGFSGDGGPATAAALASPHNVTAAPDGGFLVADTGNNRIRRVAPNGTITTIAGTGTAGFSGDGGAAVSARLFQPKAVAVNSAGDFLVADASNNRVRLLTPVLAPRRISRPTVSGRFRVGRIVVAATGRWSGTSPLRFFYKWLRCGRRGGGCARIARSTGSSYTLRPRDARSRIRVLVTAATRGGWASARSAATPVIFPSSRASTIYYGSPGSPTGRTGA